ncbi:MAG: ABC transporter permease [Gemmataceae bacterium]|nr:ABC transporter permease [Gemmataceae bacterium]
MADFHQPLTPEAAPSDLAIDEPKFARSLGGMGIGLALVGSLAVWMNLSQPRLIGPTLAVFMTIVGIALLLFHAARDGDRLVRRMYMLVGLGSLGIGVALSAVPLPVAGDGFVPGGALGLLTGLFFLLAAGRHEDETLWSGIASFALIVPALVLVIGGLAGVAINPVYLPRFAGGTLIGLLFWWAAVGRAGPDSTLGYRLGQLLGAVAFGMLVCAVVNSLLPGRYFVPRGAVLGILSLFALLLAVGITSDRPVVAMTRRELAAYFYSPIAYIVLFGSVVVGWFAYLFFISLLFKLTGRQQPLFEPIVQSYSVDFFTIISVIFIVPVVTMRLLSEERRSGTIEVLLTGPVNEWQVVISKFLAGLLYFMTLFLPWGLYLVPVYYAGRSGFDYLPLLGYFFSLVGTGAAFIATGLFCSSLTKNQIIAAALSFAAMMLYLVLPYSLQFTNWGGSIRTTIEQLSFMQVWSASVTGMIPLHQLLVYLSMTVFWLYLTTKVLEARKWS